MAWFRVRGPPPDQAFTFTLIDIHTDPDEVTRELDALADVYRVVRDDGRHEDDIILLGDLNVDDAHLGRLGKVPQIMPAISGVATNTRGTKQYDNLLFSKVGHQRIHRPLGRVRSDPPVQSDDRRGLASLGPHARLGRVQHLRRRPRRPDRHPAGRAGEVNTGAWRPGRGRLMRAGGHRLDLRDRCCGVPGRGLK